MKPLKFVFKIQKKYKLKIIKLEFDRLKNLLQISNNVIDFSVKCYYH